MRAAIVIAARILRQRLRDRSALVFAILTPLGLAAAFATLIPGDFSAYHASFVVADQDRGPMAALLVDDVLGGLHSSGVADVSPAPDEVNAADAIRAQRADAGILIPAGFSAAIAAGTPARLVVLAGAQTTAAEVARSVLGSFASDVGAVQLLVATAVVDGQAADPGMVARAQAAVREASPIATTDETTDRRQASLATFYGAAMAVMFVFFATQYGALAILSERQAGTLDRLLAAPIRPASVVLGAALAGFALGLVSMTTLVVATTLLVHAAWGPPALVAVLVVAAVAAAMGISTVLASFSRTVRQAGGLNAIVAISLAAVGGVFIPLSQAPPALVTISQLTPHAWFLRGIDTLAGRDPSLADIAQPVAVLLAMGVLTGAIGLARARRSLAR